MQKINKMEYYLRTTNNINNMTVSKNETGDTFT